MSEQEKKRRKEYREKRKSRIKLQAIILISITVLLIISLTALHIMNKSHFTETASGSVKYDVTLLENDFYDEPTLDGDGNRAYVASLIDKINTVFLYNLSVDNPDAKYSYTYSVGAHLVIKDRETNTTIFNHTYPLANEKSLESGNGSFMIREAFELDYSEYNDFATEFVDVYCEGVKTSSTLRVELNVELTGESESFAAPSEKVCSFAINVPLVTPAVVISGSSTCPAVAEKVISRNFGVMTSLLEILAIVLVSLDLVGAVILLIFIYRTRTTDITYKARLSKLVSAYKSFIQKINSEFDTGDYKELVVNTFDELLEIRDTIQSPILMFENEDETSAKFIITTQSDILYSYELKIEDYDEIYGEDTEDEADDSYDYDGIEIVEESSDTSAESEEAESEAQDCEETDTDGADTAAEDTDNTPAE